MEHIYEIEVKSLEELPAAVENILSAIFQDFSKKKVGSSSGSGQSACIVGLSGDLGAGKTTFVQTSALFLGIKERMTSPTFVIMKKYQLTNSLANTPTFSTLIHMDTYRLSGEKDLKALNFDCFAKDPQNLIFIEWPERISDPGSGHIGNDCMYSLKIDHRNDGVRIFSLSR